MPSKLLNTSRKVRTYQEAPKSFSTCNSAFLANDPLCHGILDGENSQQTSLTQDEECELTAESQRFSHKVSNNCQDTNRSHGHEPSASSRDDYLAAETKLTTEADCSIKTLERLYGSSSQLRKTDAVVIMEGWNKVLAFPTMFSEALFNRWRLLCALDALEGGTYDPNESEDVLTKAIDLLEFSTDPLAVLLGTRVAHGQQLLMGLLDASVRSLCPHSQIVQREAYRPINDDLQYLGTQSNRPMMSRLGLIHGTADEYLRTFARCGIQPSQWVHFCEAFLWAMQTHSPYSNDVDEEDLLKPKPECAYSIFVSAYIAKAAIEASITFRKKLNEPIFTVCVPRFWTRISFSSASKAMLGETFYRQLLTNSLELLDFFVNTDMDSLALHLIMALDLLVVSIDKIGFGMSSFRDVMTHLGEMHRRMKIPTASFPIVGGQLIQTLQPFFEQEEQICQGEDFHNSAEELGCAFADLYSELMAMVSHPMQCEEKLCLEAEEFFRAVASELQWNNSRLENRLWEVNMEIAATGTYSHTSEELEIGARLAWRNSAKCIGRIAWNTLVVRDCRHISRPEAIVKEVEEHLRVATCGTNIQSVMTVFRPRAPHETWGLRFWSSQFVRYAGYKLPDGESHPEANREGILGDPANLKFAEYLVKQGLWTPPEIKSAFDVLPIVLKIPGTHRPFVYQLPDQWVKEVKIEHPKCTAIKELNLRWTAVPAISNFAMNLGGVMYNCCPFNGWFVSIEIVRNLMERYQVQERWVKAMELDPQERMLEMRVQHEVQVAVIHSFAKAGFSMVDPCAVGKSFLVHAKREREQGRECPAQWSWIGGLVGPTNATWHHEMRDFFVAPQYEYASEPWMVCDLARGESSQLNFDSSDLYNNCPSCAGEDFETPRVLIVFGSQTGLAEAAAHKLARSFRLLKPTVLSLNDAAGLAIVKERNCTHVLSICSTFNRGDFPSNADVFSTTPIDTDALGGSKIAVCAVGSSAYPDFCAAGIRLQAMLEKAGGTPLMPLKKVDDAHGSMAPIAAWIHLVERLILPEHLAIALANRNPAAMTPPVHRITWLESDDRAVTFDGEGCDVVANEELLSGGDISCRSTRKLTFKLPDRVTYQAGDHLAVSPLNSLDNVVRFITCFEEELVGVSEASGMWIESIHKQMRRPMIVETSEGGATFPALLSFRTPATLASALQSSVDFSINESSLDSYVSLIIASLQNIQEGDLPRHLSVQRDTLAQLCHAVTSSNVSTRDEGVALFLARYPTIIHFLERFNALLCVGGVVKGHGPLIRLADVMVLLPKLRERYYSISSSPCDDPSLVSISVGVVHTKTSEGVCIDGICSNYLARLEPTVDKAKISIRQSTFRGPKTVESSVIMIGPGTGLAPLIGFLRERELLLSKERTSHHANVGVCYLFGGCRTVEDRIYGAEVDSWETSGVLEHHLALSRQPGKERTYVQDLLLKNGEEICQVLLQEDSHYYICGNAKVADACYEACVRILRQYGKMSRVGAVQHLRKMRANNRWQYDLWGNFSGFQQTRLDPRSKQTFAAKKWLLSFTD